MSKKQPKGDAMKKERRLDVNRILKDGKQADEAIARAAREAVLRHIRAGNRVAVGQNGKTKLLSPREIKLKIDANTGRFGLL